MFPAPLAALREQELAGTLLKMTPVTIASPSANSSTRAPGSRSIGRYSTFGNASATMARVAASWTAIATRMSIGREGPLLEFGEQSARLLPAIAATVIATPVTRAIVGPGLIYGQRGFAFQSGRTWRGLVHLG